MAGSNHLPVDEVFGRFRAARVVPLDDPLDGLLRDVTHVSRISGTPLCHSVTAMTTLPRARPVSM
jgi:hypothetical protein